jgi:hypothetical protein
MKLHAKAALTIAQRRQVILLFETQKLSLPELARRFHVHTSTIKRWVTRDSFEDRTGKQKRKARVVTPDYQQAVINYRRDNPSHGPVRIAHDLRAEFPQAHRGTILLILQSEGLTGLRPRRSNTHWRIPVGPHRVQMDIQQLPPVSSAARRPGDAGC